MTQQELNNFINLRGYGIMLGTRNSELQPTVQRGFGAKLSDDGTMISAFIPKSLSEKTIANLKDNGRAALTMSMPSTHSAWQFKGAYVSSADCNEAEMQVFYENVTAFGEFISTIFGPEKLALMHGFNLLPLVSITFKIEDVFNQTPGAGAGKKIN